MRVEYESVVPFDFEGLNIRELTPKELETASIAAIDVPPGAAHRTARSSRSDKLYVCLEGIISFIVQDREITLAPRDVLHVPTHEWFSYHNAGTELVRLLLIHVPSFDLASEEFLEARDDDA